MRKLMVTIATLLLLATATMILAQKTTGEDLFQQGLNQERAKRDIPAAIKIYERILKDFSSNSALVAKTLLELGECYEKLGEEKAQDYYRQIITKYSDQTDVAARARGHLSIGPVDPPRVREFLVPDRQNLMHAFHNGIDISPDGQRIAFVAGTNPGPGRDRRIYLRDPFGDASPIAGSEGGYNPFFSPDSQSLGFFTGGVEQEGPFRVNKIALSPGSQPIVLFQHREGTVADNLGASWGKDGTIVFGSWNKGLQTIPNNVGGTPQPLTSLDRAANETSHRHPHFLPDGSGVIFTVTRNAPGGFRSAQIWVLSMKTHKRKLLLEDGIDARPGPNNTLVFAREGQLFAVKFDMNTLSVSGSPVLMNDGAGVTHAVRDGGSNSRTGAAQYSVSTNGTLVYARGSIEPAGSNRVVWVDQQGNVTPLDIEPREYYDARVSPNGKSVLISGSSTGADKGVWLYDTSTKTLEHHIEGDAERAVWESDTRFAFISHRDGPIGIYVKDVNSSDIKRVASGSSSFPVRTPDRGWISMSDLTKSILSPKSTPANTTGPEGVTPTYRKLTVSPDGHWLAYSSNESGNPQIYVKPYPGPGPSVQISGRTGSVPGAPREDGPALEVFWSRDGQRLFYRARIGLGNPSTVSVPFSVINGQFFPEPGTVLFTNSAWACTEVCGDVTPDGRFVMVMPGSPEEQLERNKKIFPTTLTVVVNWSTELQRALNKTR